MSSNKLVILKITESTNIKHHTLTWVTLKTFLHS